MICADELDHAIATLPPWALVILCLGVLAFFAFVLWLWER